MAKRNTVVLGADHCSLLTLKMSGEAVLQPLLQLFLLFLFLCADKQHGSIGQGNPSFQKGRSAVFFPDLEAISGVLFKGIIF